MDFEDIYRKHADKIKTSGESKVEASGVEPEEHEKSEALPTTLYDFFNTHPGDLSVGDAAKLGIIHDTAVAIMKEKGGTLSKVLGNMVRSIGLSSSTSNEQLTGLWKHIKLSRAVQNAIKSSDSRRSKQGAGGDASGGVGGPSGAVPASIQISIGMPK